MQINLYNYDCLDILDKLINKQVKVDCIIADLPYGTTAHAWDKIIPSKPMWEKIEKILKPNGVCALFATQPFTTMIIASNIDRWRYNWIWDKGQPSGFLNANYSPLKRYEDICVFSRGTVGSLSKNPIIYYPQGVVPINKVKKNNPNSTWRINNGYNTNTNKLNSDTEYVQKYTNYPHNILVYPRDKEHFHPTQKPVALLEYLIKTYTKESETVLDMTMGSGSTGVACVNSNRSFIGIEIQKKYFDIANKRIRNNQKP